jgi:hypothetical protein
VKKKQVLKKECIRRWSNDNKIKYKKARKEAKQIAAEAKSRSWDELYGELKHLKQQNNFSKVFRFVATRPI